MQNLGVLELNFLEELLKFYEQLIVKPKKEELQLLLEGCLDQLTNEKCL
jgi:hypothetical protein